eukprot:8992681-Pyramimonas_sp.AAC.1
MDSYSEPKADPRCATLGRGAPRAPGAPLAPGTPGARACQARCARARDSTHRETCRPPPSLSKTDGHNC